MAKGKGYPTSFKPGNQVGMRHGANGVIALQPRAAELADGLREVVPTYCASDEYMVRSLALVLARIERATAWLDEHDIFSDKSGNMQPVLRMLSTWENTAARLCDQLGLSPASRARLGLDLSRTNEALRQHLDENYGGDGGV
jgi:phage terminase small subunit